MIIADKHQTSERFVRRTSLDRLRVSLSQEEEASDRTTGKVYCVYDRWCGFWPLQPKRCCFNWLYYPACHVKPYHDKLCSSFKDERYHEGHIELHRRKDHYQTHLSIHPYIHTATLLSRDSLEIATWTNADTQCYFSLPFLWPFLPNNSFAWGVCERTGYEAGHTISVSFLPLRPVPRWEWRNTLGSWTLAFRPHWAASNDFLLSNLPNICRLSKTTQVQSLKSY